MAKYWIRNRGRVQGPFTEDRIQGLLRRGRFSRHFHVSEDRKNWFPASDFPELFEGVGAPPSAEEDASPFQSGGSPFADDYDDEPQARTKSSGRRGARRRVPEDEDFDDDDELDDDEVDDDDEEDEWDDDEDWDDDDAGVLTGFVNWIEANVKLVIVLLVGVLGALSWFVFLREDFTQDVADMEKLSEIHSRIVTAHQTGTAANDWIRLSETTEAELAPMVARLQEQASAMDMVKQELLFLARDDVPRMFKELSRGKQDTANLARTRLTVINTMIMSKTRFHDGSAYALRPPQQPQAPPPQAQQPQQTPQSSVPPGQTGQPSGAVQPENVGVQPPANIPNNTTNPQNAPSSSPAVPGGNPQQ